VPSADTMMLLDDAYVAGARSMVRKLANHDVDEVYQAGCGQGPIAELAAEPMQSRRLDF
jgi:hypothetical protein